MNSRAQLPDGLTALSERLTLVEIMRLIEGTARWVDRATFDLLPVWYPEFARGDARYNTNWSAPQTNTSSATGRVDHRRETNEAANSALTLALGLRSNGRTNWSCCHIWGADASDARTINVVVRDHRYYSCIANMVLLPTPLKAFTDAMPSVKAMLRLCAMNYYGWVCEHDAVASEAEALKAFDDVGAYPASWPDRNGGAPPGVLPLNDAIRRDADRRLHRIRHDLVHAGEHYPRDTVRSVMSHWQIPL